MLLGPINKTAAEMRMKAATILVLFCVTLNSIILIVLRNSLESREYLSNYDFTSICSSAHFVATAQSEKNYPELVNNITNQLHVESSRDVGKARLSAG